MVAAASARAPNDTGPPGHAWVRKTIRPKADTTSSAAVARPSPLHQADMAAARPPMDHARVPMTARAGAPSDEPPMMGWFQIAITAGRHVSGEPLAAADRITSP